MTAETLPAATRRSRRRRRVRRLTTRDKLVVSVMLGIPLLLDLAKTDEERKVMTLLASDAAVGRGFMMPQNVPKDRVQAMRRAFDETLKDPKFVADAKRRKLDLHVMSGAQLQKEIDELFRTPKSVIASAKVALGY